jgi:anti-sigma regulatory factor (Ser/Thr protein kinase)
MTSPERPGTASAVLEQAFDGGTLTMLRNAAAAHASALGLRDGQVDDIVLIVQELAANAVRHGAGTGVLRLSRLGDRVICRVDDAGPAPDGLASAGLRPMPPGNVGGRGLWLVRHFSSDLDIRTGPDGTRITATVDILPGT